MSKILMADKKLLVKNPVFLNGIGRTGKFFTARIISCFKNIEYFHYVAMLQNISYIQRLGLMTEDAAAFGMYGIGDRLPSPGLVFGEEPGCKHVPVGFFRDLGGFGDQQPCRGPLGIVGGCHGFGHPVFVVAVAGHGGHDHAIGQFKVAQGVW